MARKTLSSIAKQLEKSEAWQHTHEQEDINRFTQTPTIVETSVKKVVNGQIKDVQAEVAELRKEMQAHIKVVEPYLQAGAGVGILTKGLMWVGGLAAGWIALKQMFPGL